MAQSRRSGGRRESAYEDFIARYPEYESTGILDDLREREYSRLDDGGHVYLDYTGGGLYAASQVKAHADLLLNTVLGNPHSISPASMAATELVERCRRRVGEYFGASPSEYAVIFTANASHALKLVGEAYPFGPKDQFLLTFDNHNSVNGIREFDRARGSVTRYVPVLPPDMRVPEVVLDTFLDDCDQNCNNLFAYPAQSNFSGVQHPLEWISKARDRGWDVLLDAAAFVATNRLDLSAVKPDFAAMSFYKMFGYPTGAGALIARREALDKLNRPWFAGGTITVASVQADQHFLASGAEAWEDGTLNYACLPAVDMGLDFLDNVGIDTIRARVRSLTGWLIEQILAMRHANGQRLARLYGPTNTHMRGGTVTINVYDADGNGIDHTRVEERANRERISLRTGCFCNPGAGEMALGLEKGELDACFADADRRMSLNEFRQCIDGKSTGAVRVSSGLATNFDDIWKFVRFLEGFIDGNNA